MRKIQLTFTIQKGDDTKWELICNETNFLVGVDTRKHARFLKNNIDEWEWIDSEELNETICFIDAKGNEHIIEGTHKFEWQRLNETICKKENETWEQWKNNHIDEWNWINEKFGSTMPKHIKRIIKSI